MSKLDVFAQWSPIDLNKTQIVKSEDGKTYFIKGIASTEHVDSHGEIILQDGLDFSYCLKNGCFNYDHMNDPKYILGAPQKISKSSAGGKKATVIEGILYAEKSIVQDLMENIKVMKSTNSGRSLGFSIEGQVLARDSRDPKIVTRAKVLNVSLTHTPANVQSTVELVKNIMSQNVADKKEDQMNKNDEYADLPMTLSEAKASCDYADKLVMLLEGLPMNVDLPEWTTRKISMAKEYLQVAYHYLDQEMKDGMLGESEIDKDVNPQYLNSLEEESVVEPHAVEPPSVERDNDYPQSFEKACMSEEEMDKMDRKQMIDYMRFLQSLLAKETDLSPIQTESLEDNKEELASEDTSGPLKNIGEEDDDEEEGVEVEIEGLTPEQLKELIMGMLKLGLPVEKMAEYIESYSKK